MSKSERFQESEVSSGRKARDTFASLKKTCKKLGVCFWDYLRDRVGMHGEIQPLTKLMIARAQESPG